MFFPPNFSISCPTFFYTIFNVHPLPLRLLNPLLRFNPYDFSTSTSMSDRITTEGVLQIEKMKHTLTVAANHWENTFKCKCHTITHVSSFLESFLRGTWCTSTPKMLKLRYEIRKGFLNISFILSNLLWLASFDSFLFIFHKGKSSFIFEQYFFFFCWVLFFSFLSISKELFLWTLSDLSVKGS